jgi:putative transposase
MLRRQGFKFELRPNGEQDRKMRQFAGACRFVYNAALELQSSRYQGGGKHLTYAALCRELTGCRQEYPWLADVPVHALQQSLKDLCRAFTNFFAKRASYPHPHKKGRQDSFRIPSPDEFEFDQQNSRIKLPKLGWIRYRNSRKILGEPANVTVSHSCGRWYISVQTEREVETPVHSSTSRVGLDWGIANFITPSRGEPLQSLSPLKQNASKLARFERRLAGKKKFSNNWKKLRTKICKLHQHIANARKDFIHKASHSISKNHAVVCVEDLQVRNMSKSAKGSKEQPGQNVKAKSGLNRSILDASPFELRRQLEYKTLWRGGILVAVPAQNTSRRCPACGHAAKENRKTQRKFICVECGFSGNADLVAACNIEEAGLALLACSQPSGISSSRQEPTEVLLAR